jgi:hypothetical protein
MSSYSQGDGVSWAWGQGRAEGVIKEIFTDKVTRTLQGSEVTRNGSDDDPALLIEQEGGTQVLKLKSEVRKKPQ